MAHCFSIGITIDGKERTICTTHVPGNEALRSDVEAGRLRELTDEEIKRAVEYEKRYPGKHVPESPAPRRDPEPQPAERYRSQ